MVENARSGATSWLALLVGGLIVAVAVIGYFLYSRGDAMHELPPSINVTVETPKAPPIPDAPRLPDAPIPTPK